MIRNFGFKEKIKVVRTGAWTWGLHGPSFSGPETEIFSRKSSKTILEHVNLMELSSLLNRKIGTPQKGQIIFIESREYPMTAIFAKLTATYGHGALLIEWLKIDLET